jgi:hypothetical protein
LLQFSSSYFALTPATSANIGSDDLRLKDDPVIISKNDLDICWPCKLLWPCNTDPKDNAALEVPWNPVEGIVF